MTPGGLLGSYGRLKGDYAEDILDSMSSPQPTPSLSHKRARSLIFKLDYVCRENRESFEEACKG